LIVGLTFCFATGTIASAQEYKDFGTDRLNSSPRHGEWVDIKSGDSTIKPSSFIQAQGQSASRAGHSGNFWSDRLARQHVRALAKMGHCDCARFPQWQKFEMPMEQAKRSSAVTQIRSSGSRRYRQYGVKIPACNSTLAVCDLSVGDGRSRTQMRTRN